MSSRLVLLGEDALECAVGFGVVGTVVLPAVPDDVEPGPGEDPDGVGVVVAPGSGTVVEVRGPGVGIATAVGEVGDGVAELFVARPAEADGSELAGLPGRWCCPGQAGQRFGGGEPGSAVADLGQQPRRADPAGSGQAGKDVRIGVRVELAVDLGRQCLDLLEQGQQQRSGSACSPPSNSTRRRSVAPTSTKPWPTSRAYSSRPKDTALGALVRLSNMATMGAGTAHTGRRG